MYIDVIEVEMPETIEECIVEYADGKVVILKNSRKENDIEIFEESRREICQTGKSRRS